MAASRVFRYTDGIWPNLAAFTYTGLALTTGIWLGLAPQWWLNLLGVILLAHGLATTAFLMHELIHSTIFFRRTANERVAMILSWINGSCYALVLDLKNKHIQHHVDKSDVVTFDFRQYLDRHPTLLRAVVVLEWMYFPAVEFLMRLSVVTIPFVDSNRRHLRGRVIAIVLIRLAAFLALFLWHPKLSLVYVAAYLVFITAMRFIDAFQHTFDAVVLDYAASDTMQRSRDYEEANTYSNLISTRFPFLNLLTLNFVYHNAHHAKPGIPWHRLPRLHRELFGTTTYPQVIPVGVLLRNFHRYRIRRVLVEDFGHARDHRYDDFVGTVGVSFLTAV